MKAFDALNFNFSIILFSRGGRIHTCLAFRFLWIMNPELSLPNSYKSKISGKRDYDYDANEPCWPQTVNIGQRCLQRRYDVTDLRQSRSCDGTPSAT